VVEAASGAQEVLAHLGLPGPPQVDRYGVDLAAFERVALPALHTPASGVVVVDELGKMELASTAFRAAVLELLGRGCGRGGRAGQAPSVHRCPQASARHPGGSGHRRHPRCPARAAHGTAGRRYPTKGRSRDWSVRSWPGGGGPGQAGGPRAGLGPPGAGAGSPGGQEQPRRPAAPGPGASPGRRQAAVHGRPPPDRRTPFILLDPARLEVPPRRAASSDLEFALLVEAGLIGTDTVVATTVHPLQVLEEPLPETGHDFRLDVIVAGEEVITCRRARRPKGLLWDHLDAARIAAIPALAARTRQDGPLRP
jgi:hypothetical protein